MEDIKEDVNLNKKQQSADVTTDMTQVLELSDEDFEAVIIKVLKWTTTYILKTNEKIEIHSKEMSQI